jgi:undecaprenyl diphosphate synthase
MSKEFSIDEMNSNLYTADEPDILIRTSGETRLSDFMTWQCGNSLLYFCQQNWPEFSEFEFFKVLLEYQDQFEELKRIK